MPHRVGLIWVKFPTVRSLTRVKCPGLGGMGGFGIDWYIRLGQQLTYKIVYTCIDVISSEEDLTENTKQLSPPQRLEILIKKFLSFSVLRHAATGKFSGEQ